MDSRNRTRPLANNQPVVISAATLKGAYKLVKDEFGEDAIILGSRTVTKRQALGLGHEKVVEVMVQNPSGLPGGFGKSAPRLSSTFIKDSQPDSSSQKMMAEVERIEELVKAIAEDFEKFDPQASITQGNPLAESLVKGGTSTNTIEKLLTRFTSETGQPSNDRVSALSWLGENLRASNCEWEGFYGCHAFMGPIGSGTTDLILATAAKLQELGRRTLVLNVLPEDRSSIKQLQVEASRCGFDAAVIQKISQLSSSEEHLKRYDVVLVDMPDLGHSSMATGGPLHGWLAGNNTFHRHILIPVNQDPRDMDTVTNAARSWNCDWLGLTRLELTGRPAKILDFADATPLPISLIQNLGQVEIASSAKLLDFILGLGHAGSNPGQINTAKG